MSRRVWVKRPNGTPTTITVQQADIVDDLKSAIINKFPNSLARSFDPADLIIKVSTKPTSVPAHKKNFPSFSFPDISRSPNSPLASAPSPSSHTVTTLDPDQNVWGVLDHFFPKGMTMQDSFIIEGPEVDPLHSQSSQSFNYYAQPTSFQPQASRPPPLDETKSSVAFNPSPKFHQPQPQYGFRSSVSGKDLSMSPESTSKQSPVPSNIHKGLQATSSRSPAPELPPTVSSSSSATAAGTDNSQVVLLLPKNFSLAAGSQSGVKNVQDPHNKKRLSFDESLISKNSSFKSPPSSSTNLTNIGMSSTHASPFPLPVSNPMNTLPPLDVNRLSNEQSLAGDTNPSHPEVAKAVSIGDSLDSPIPDSPTTEAPLGSLDSVLKTDTVPGKKAELKSLKAISEKKANKSPSAKTNTERVLPSISVLVVEDNAINQAILGAFLRKHRIHYQIAKNGQEAIDKWRTGGFHLVLMDIQLPVKSGIEATKEIRHLEKANRIGVFAQHELTNSHYHNQTILKPEEKLDLNIFRSPVIIVALTASSNSSVDKKNALMAGCNDYLTKPVNLVWLQNKITEWGCMQALIDFDGWRDKSSNNPGKDAKSAVSTPKAESPGVLLSNKKLLASQ